MGAYKTWWFECPRPEILPAVLRLRACETGLNARSAACAQNLGSGAFDCAMQQSQPDLPRFSDEPFTIHDVQFDNPQIGVLAPATIQIVLEF
jgi:hypothetical protein